MKAYVLIRYSHNADHNTTEKDVVGVRKTEQECFDDVQECGSNDNTYEIEVFAMDSPSYFENFTGKRIEV